MNVSKLPNGKSVLIALFPWSSTDVFLISAMSKQNLSYFELCSTLKNLESKIDEAYKEIKTSVEEKEKIKNQLVTLAYEHPLDVKTTQSTYYKTKEGRLQMRNMSRTELYNFFQDGYNQPRTKEQKEEAAHYLLHTFASDNLPFAVIIRALQAHKWKLAPSYMMIKAWMEEGSPLNFNWKPPGEKTHNYRMIFHYEQVQMEEMKRKRKQYTPCTKLNLFLPPSYPLILEIQFLAVLKDRKKSVDNPMMEKDWNLSLCQNGKIGSPERESTISTSKALNIQNEKLPICLYWNPEEIKVMKEVFNAMKFLRFVSSFQIASHMSEKPIMKYNFQTESCFCFVLNFLQGKLWSLL